MSHFGPERIFGPSPRSANWKKEAGVVALDQIEQWRAQLKEEPPSFARDLAHVLLLEIERLHAAELACERKFAEKVAAGMRAQLATTTECPTCSDAALRRAEETMRAFRPRSGQQTDGSRGTIATPTPALPRYR
jgi:hypothetical protein